jgi:hypothetical protein
MRIHELLIETKQLDPDVFEEVSPQTIARIARRTLSKLFPGAKISIRATPEGYAEIHMPSDNMRPLNISIGASIADGDMSVNLSGGVGAANSGEFKGGITQTISAVRDYLVKYYGVPTQPVSLSIDSDVSHGAWQHIASKLGMQYCAN